MKTIRQQLRIALAGGMLVFSVAASFLLYTRARNEADEQADLLLMQVAATLPTQLTSSLHLPAAESREDHIVVQAWHRDGTLIYSTRTDIQFPIQTEGGYKQIQFHDKPWIAYALMQQGRIVQVAQPTAVRKDQAAELVNRLLIPLLVLLALLGAFCYIVVGRVLRPLEALAASLAARAPDATTPLTQDDHAPDLGPIVCALNGLLERVNQTLRLQREFTANAAHELRTPLTALHLQLQLAERAKDDVQRTLSFQKMHDRLDRSARLVNQLLTLARCEPTRTSAIGNIDLLNLARTTVSDFNALAEQRSIDLGLDERSCMAPIHGDGDQLGTALNNLVDNALRYCRPGDRVDVHVWHEDGRAHLRVSDTGPGVAEGDLPNLCERFYRPTGSDGIGCGLGLAIVRNIAERHHAQLRLEHASIGTGLVVVLIF